MISCGSFVLRGRCPLNTQRTGNDRKRSNFIREHGLDRRMLFPDNPNDPVDILTAWKKRALPPLP
jgi:hypothetical protein